MFREILLSSLLIIMLCLACILLPLQQKQNYATIDASIPLYSSKSLPQDSSQLSDNSLSIILDEHYLIVGSIESFTRGRNSLQENLIIPYANGAIISSKLAKGIQEYSKKYPHPPDSVILFAIKKLPMAILIQVMSLLKKDHSFKHIVIGKGIIG